MPVIKNRTVLETVRNIKVFLNLDAGVTRGQTPELEPISPQPGAGERPGDRRGQLELARRRLEVKEGENARLRAELAASGEGSGVKPENMIWLFGSGRSGSTWLSHMMMDIEGHTLWGEPLVGKLFADLYYGQTGRLQSEIESFILSKPHKEAWLRSIRHLVFDGANARYPEVAEENGYVVISEPNGSTGAPLLMEALPESRMIFLLRDPRDVVASYLAASRKGSWLSERWSRNQRSLADEDPEVFVKQRANLFMQHAGHAREAYEMHTGPKVMVRYEELRADTLATMKRICSTLQLSVDEEELSRVVDRHSWENIPQEKKGEGKFFRKATPGGWQEDLTPEQVEMVEDITKPLLEEFYTAGGRDRT